MRNAEMVHRAKAHLHARVRGQPWYHGMGIVPRGNQLILRLNVSPEVDDSELPQEIDGIPIEIVRLESYEQRGR